MLEEREPLVLREKEACMRVGLKRTTFRELVSRGEFLQIRLSERIRGYALSELDAWLMRKIEEARTTRANALGQVNEGGVV